MLREDEPLRHVELDSGRHMASVGADAEDVAARLDHGFVCTFVEHRERTRVDADRAFVRFAGLKQLCFPESAKAHRFFKQRLCCFGSVELYRLSAAECTGICYAHTNLNLTVCICRRNVFCLK